MASSNKPRIFLDTNVIFSGLYSKQGAPGRILKLFVLGNIEILISRQVLDELIVTIRHKFPQGLPDLERFLLNTPPEIIVDPGPEVIKPWRSVLSIGDAAILSAAVQSGPDYFVTCDNHFLESPEMTMETGLKIITPGEFLRIFEKKA